MNDNIILYAISLICIILLLIEWIFISHKKCSINAIVFVGYSFPLYYLMICKGAGGEAFTWWFYLVLFTSIHVIILLIILFYFFSTILRRRANERKQRCDKWNEGCAFFWSLSHTAASSSHSCDRASCRWSTFPQAHRKPFGWKATTARCPCWSPRLPCSCSPLAALELYVNKTTITAIKLLILRSFQKKDCAIVA